MRYFLTFLFYFTASGTLAALPAIIAGVLVYEYVSRQIAALEAEIALDRRIDF